ncbi:hypothetical protein S4A8_06763 [Salinisphaera sp. S4-8]
MPADGGDFAMGPTFAILNEKDAASGTAQGHYFHQDIFVANRIFHAAPERHVDVGSRIDGFVAHVAAFRPVEVFDIRPLIANTHNIRFQQIDLAHDLPEHFVGCTDSLSCLHAIEHFGLGRYGDRIQYDGHCAGLRNLTRLLRTGGTLYLSTPIGPQRVEFNAHRVFSLNYLLEWLTPTYDIQSFSFVDDAGDFHPFQSLDDHAAVESNFGCHYGCGIFELTKKAL